MPLSKAHNGFINDAKADGKRSMMNSEVYRVLNAWVSQPQWAALHLLRTKLKTERSAPENSYSKDLKRENYTDFSSIKVYKIMHTVIMYLFTRGLWECKNERNIILYNHFTLSPSSWLHFRSMAINKDCIDISSIALKLYISAHWRLKLTHVHMSML